MKNSEWKIKKSYFGGQGYYTVYSIRNTNNTEQSGSIIYSGGYIADRQKAEQHAKQLNEQEQLRA